MDAPNSPNHGDLRADAKHRAAVHVSEAMNRRNKWAMPAIIIGVLVVGGGMFALSRVDNRPDERAIRLAIAHNEAQAITAVNGQIGNMGMADETAVKMGAGSRMRVPKDFGGAIRAVGLVGTASFVIPTQAQPFQLWTGDVSTSISKGTLDVRADSAKPILLRVRDGQATVKSRDSTWSVAAGQSLVIDSKGSARAPTEAETEEALGWIDRRFGASGTVSEVVAQINRWYGSDLGIGDAGIADRPATVKGSLDTLQSSIKSIEKSAKLKMSWVKERMVLFNAGK